MAKKMRGGKSRSIYQNHQAQAETMAPAAQATPAPATAMPAAPASAPASPAQSPTDIDPARRRREVGPGGFGKGTAFAKFAQKPRMATRKLKGLSPRPNEFGMGYGEDRVY